MWVTQAIAFRMLEQCETQMPTRFAMLLQSGPLCSSLPYIKARLVEARNISNATLRQNRPSLDLTLKGSARNLNNTGYITDAKLVIQSQNQAKCKAPRMTTMMSKC